MNLPRDIIFVPASAGFILVANHLLIINEVDIPKMPLKKKTAVSCNLICSI